MYVKWYSFVKLTMWRFHKLIQFSLWIHFMREWTLREHQSEFRIWSLFSTLYIDNSLQFLCIWVLICIKNAKSVRIFDIYLTIFNYRIFLTPTWPPSNPEVTFVSHFRRQNSRVRQHKALHESVHFHQILCAVFSYHPYEKNSEVE